MERGTDWRLMEKERIEMEPAVIKEAMETRKIMAIWFIDKVKVRGREILTTLAIAATLILKDGLGNKPEATTNGTCTKACMLAPTTTPIATPITPMRSARNIIPPIMPAL